MPYWHNLRASRETELTARFPLHVVAQWLGHTPKVATQHYLQVTDEHFALAVANDEAESGGTTGGANTARNGMKSTAIDTDPIAVSSGKLGVSEVIDTSISRPGGIRTPDQGIMSPLL